MIGFLEGRVLFSDKMQMILSTPGGIGYEIYFSEILPEGETLNLYISSVIRENGHFLYGFRQLKEKKMFELLMDVKGVGPKSSYGILMNLGFEETVRAIAHKEKSILSRAPGIGPKAAAQIILDLGSKINKMMSAEIKINATQNSHGGERESDGEIIQEAIEACRELGFPRENVEPIILRLIKKNSTQQAHQLVHQVLKEI